MNIWLEKTYPSKRNKGDFTSLLLSPTEDARGADIYSNMRKVQSGDIVFHLDQDTNNIIGYSIATAKYEIITINHDDYYTINLQDYQSLANNLNIDTFLTNPDYQKLLTEVKKNKEVFYQLRDNKFYVKQGGYLTNLDKQIADLFNQDFEHEVFEPEPDEIDNELFSEGKVKYRIHKHKERNRKLIKTAKENFKMNNDGKLFCEVCGFDFSKRYGLRGEDFIEAHHTIPIHSIAEDYKTNVNEIALLCSNCHRMIHRRPWLSIDELRDILK